MRPKGARLPPFRFDISNDFPFIVDTVQKYSLIRTVVVVEHCELNFLHHADHNNFEIGSGLLRWPWACNHWGLLVTFLNCDDPARIAPVHTICDRQEQRRMGSHMGVCRLGMQQAER